MAANSIAPKKNYVPPEEVRKKILSQVYRFILEIDLPDPRNTEPAAASRPRLSAVGSEGKTLAVTMADEGQEP